MQGVACSRWLAEVLGGPLGAGCDVQRLAGVLCAQEIASETKRRWKGRPLRALRWLACMHCGGIASCA